MPAACTARRRRPQAGVTLIELMVALVLAMLLGVAILFIQRTLTQHNSRSSDIALRDNEARAGMDLIAHDLSSAGFLFGGTQLPCDALFTYNAATTTDHHTRFPVDAMAASAGLQMPFTPALTLNYPSAAQALAGFVSDVLVLTGAMASSNFNDATSPLVGVSPNAVYTPMSTGVLPLVTSSGLVAGHVGVLQVPDNGRRACFRVPLTAIGSASGSVNVASTGTLMPPDFYNGFAAQFAAAGLVGPLSNAELFQGRIIDFGATTAPTQTTTAFYIDGAASAWPTLMRATFSLLDDTPIGAPQPIAAGVVSLQVRFGVDPGDTGQVTAYESAAQVLAARHQSAVLSIRVAMVTRSLYADPDFSNAGSSVAIGNGFTAVPIPTAFARHRHVVHQTEAALRNCQWQRC